MSNFSNNLNIPLLSGQLILDNLILMVKSKSIILVNFEEVSLTIARIARGNFILCKIDLEKLKKIQNSCSKNAKPQPEAATQKQKKPSTNVESLGGFGRDGKI